MQLIFNFKQYKNVNITNFVYYEKTLFGFFIFSPAPLSAPHTALRDSVFRGYTIPRENCLIFANLFAVHRDPGLFPDPEIFNPSRFIDSDGLLLKNDSVIPFSMGIFHFLFFQIFGGHQTCHWYLFWTYGDSSSGFQSQSGQPYSCMYMLHAHWDSPLVKFLIYLFNIPYAKMKFHVWSWILFFSKTKNKSSAVSFDFP